MRGLVEQLHEAEGVHGWALDPTEPARVLDIELWAGTLCMARTQTGLDRPEVCASIGVSCRPGFRFGDDAALALRDAAAQGQMGDVHVKVHGSGRLEAQCPRRTLEMIRQESAAAGRGDRLLAMLNHHASGAIPLAGEVDGSAQATRVGYLEGIWTSRSGLVWLVGWMIEDTVLDRPVIILDTARHPAGIAFSVAQRTDLGPDSKAFVAVMQTDWQPDVDLPPQILLADGSGRFLEPVRSAFMTSPEAVLPIVRDTLNRASGPHRAAMLDLLKANRHTPVKGGTASRVQVDEIAVLPGFGAFVSGWALSVSRQADRFVLMADDHTIPADHRSMMRVKRTDLAGVFPNVDQALHTAGFITLFRGPIEEATLDRLSLKVTWHDGSSTIADVAPAAVRVLGLTSALESICRFYPAIEVEEFFADFAYHAARSSSAQASRVQGYECNPVRSSLLLAVPKQRADIFLLFDQAAKHAASLPAEWGLSIIACADEHRGLVLTLFAQLQRATPRPCSLFFTAGATPTSDVIEDVAETLSSDRIAWVASHASLTAAGWHGLARATDNLVLLAVDDPLEGAPPALGLDAFVADVAQWRHLCAAAPPRIGGIQLPSQSGPLPVVANAALSLAGATQSPFTLKINEAIHRAYG